MSSPNLVAGKLTRVGFLVAALALVLAAQGQPPVLPTVPIDVDAITDAHALLAPAQMEESLDRLVEYLVRPAGNDRDKVRALYRWITDRIRYDVDAFQTNHPGYVYPEDVLRERRATCFGYASLFEAMARRAGLEAASIPGLAKGILADEDNKAKANHVWNAVKVDGFWQFVDATRGAGFVKGQRFHQVFQEQYFLTPPAQFIRTHLPADPRWQLLPLPVTFQQFEAIPYVKSSFFSVGLAHEAPWQKTKIPGQRPLVQSKISSQAHLHAGSVKMLAGPPTGKLPRGKDCYFLIEAPQAAQMVLLQKHQSCFLAKNGTRFEGLIRTQPGELKLCLKRQPQDEMFQTVVVYQVSDK